jgi:hypothetical protein
MPPKFVRSGYGPALPGARDNDASRKLLSESPATDDEDLFVDSP